MRRDQCYDSGALKKSCDANLTNELKSLPADPKKWPMPPVPGTEGESDRFRRDAIIIFGK